MFGGTAVPVARDSSAVTIVMPADGPSLGVAPSGMCRWTSARLKNELSAAVSSRKVLANVCAI